MTDEQDRLEKAKSFIDSALTGIGEGLTPDTTAACTATLKLSAAVALALLDLAENVREVRRLCEDEARCDGCGCGDDG